MSKQNGTYKPLTLEVFIDGMKEFYESRDKEELERRVPQEAIEFSLHLYYLNNRNAWDTMYNVIKENISKQM